MSDNISLLLTAGMLKKRKTFPIAKQREASVSEAEFFIKRRDVPAYAAEDGSVVFNPHASLNENQRLRETILARIVAKDPSLGPYSTEQQFVAKTLLGKAE